MLHIWRCVGEKHRRDYGNFLRIPQSPTLWSAGPWNLERSPFLIRALASVRFLMP